jgi:hypothetical protein
MCLLGAKKADRCRKIDVGSKHHWGFCSYVIQQARSPCCKWSWWMKPTFWTWIQAAVDGMAVTRRPRKIAPSAGKIVCTVFLAEKSVIRVKYLPTLTTVTLSPLYCNTEHSECSPRSGSSHKKITRTFASTWHLQGTREYASRRRHYRI